MYPARADQPFDFQAADENFRLSLAHGSRFAIGPSLAVQGSRKGKDVGANLSK